MTDIQPGEPQPQANRRRWRERTWSLPVVVAVALVAVLLGGLGGAALAAVGDHQDGRRGPGFGRGFGRGFGGPGMPGPGRQQQQRVPGGRLQPFGTVPDPGQTPAPPPTATPAPAPSS